MQREVIPPPPRGTPEGDHWIQIMFAFKDWLHARLEPGQEAVPLVMGRPGPDLTVFDGCFQWIETDAGSALTAALTRSTTIHDSALESRMTSLGWSVGRAVDGPVTTWALSRVTAEDRPIHFGIELAYELLWPWGTSLPIVHNSFTKWGRHGKHADVQAPMSIDASPQAGDASVVQLLQLFERLELGDRVTVLTDGGAEDDESEELDWCAVEREDGGWCLRIDVNRMAPAGAWLSELLDIATARVSTTTASANGALVLTYGTSEGVTLSRDVVALVTAYLGLGPDMVLDGALWEFDEQPDGRPPLRDLQDPIAEMWW